MQRDPHQSWSEGPDVHAPDSINKEGFVFLFPSYGLLFPLLFSTFFVFCASVTAISAKMVFFPSGFKSLRSRQEPKKISQIINQASKTQYENKNTQEWSLPLSLSFTRLFWPLTQFFIISTEISHEVAEKTDIHRHTHRERERQTDGERLCGLWGVVASILKTLVHGNQWIW